MANQVKLLICLAGMLLLMCCRAEMSCDPTSCGAKPLFEILCSDGSSVGAGPCVFNNETQKCGYEFPECPPVPVCNATSCGPRPLYRKRCPDGTSVGAGSCVYNNATKECGYSYPQCPVPICNSTATCGPQPKIASYICPDGLTVAGPGPCAFNNVTKTCGYPITSCPKCKKNADCKVAQTYCSTDGLCHASGTCSGNRDCVNSGNVFPIPRILPIDQVSCLTCNEGRCGPSFSPCSKACPSSTNFTNCDACSRAKNCLLCLSGCF